MISEDGVPLTGTTNGGIKYYKNPETGKHYREDFIEKAFTQMLAQSELQEDFIKKLKQGAKDGMKIKSEQIAQSRSAYLTQIEKIDKRMENLEDKYLDEEISHEEYLRMKKKYEEKKNEILGQIPKKESENNRARGVMTRTALESIKMASQSYETLSEEKKQQFIKISLLEIFVNSGKVFIKAKKETEQAFNLSKVLCGGAVGATLEKNINSYLKLEEAICKESFQNYISQIQKIFSFSSEKSSSASRCQKKNSSAKGMKKLQLEKTSR